MGWVSTFNYAMVKMLQKVLSRVNILYQSLSLGREELLIEEEVIL